MSPLKSVMTMIRSFLNGLRRVAGQSAGHAARPAIDGLAVEAGRAVYALGDIHGQIGQLRQALAWIEGRTRIDRANGLEPLVIFLGDYVDRGEDSRAVLQTLCELQHRMPEQDWVFLAGNHESALLGFLEDPVAHAGWLRFGGVETLASYGILAGASQSARDLHLLRDRLDETIPDAHLDLLRRLETQYLCGDYIFVHAGLRPGVPLASQSEQDMLWIREDFLEQPYWHGKCVVHGHTIEPEPSLLDWRIGIDTGAYAGGMLTCLALEGNRRDVIGFPPS